MRRELAKGGKAAIAASKDPMIKLALLVDGPARKARRTREEQVDEPLRQAYAKIAKARFAVGGGEVYPDATFTLRLAFGVVKGYNELGQPLPPWTTLGGAYQHAAEHHNREPFNLPKRWLEGKDRLKLDTPLNFVSTADIIGGNSGSPVVNRQGQFVGIIFDGNLESLVWDFVYTDKVGRATRRAQPGHRRNLAEALRCRQFGGRTWQIGDEIPFAPLAWLVVGVRDILRRRMVALPAIAEVQSAPRLSTACDRFRIASSFWPSSSRTSTTGCSWSTTTWHSALPACRSLGTRHLRLVHQLRLQL